MKIDMHLHTSDWSDGKQSAVATIEQGIRNGLDGLVITDHDRMLRPDEQDALRQQFPDFKIFRGAELSCEGLEHINVIGGMPQDLPPVNGAWSMEFIRDFVKDTGAFTMLNHPYWVTPAIGIDLDVFCPDAMDIMSANVDAGRCEQFLEIVKDRQMLVTAASDAHDARQLGMFCVELDEDVDTDEELVRALKAGRYAISCIDAIMKIRCDEIVAEEAIYESCVAQGGDQQSFKDLGGTFIWKRYQSGGSYMPQKDFLGLRGDHYINT